MTKDITDNWNGPQDFIPTGSIRWDSSWPESGKEDRHKLLSFLEDRFGIKKAVFDDFLLFRKNKSWWLLGKSDHLRQASSLKVSIVGLKAFQSIGQYVKPATRMIQVFGRHAVRALIDITEANIREMIDGRPVCSDLKLDNGYVILSLRGIILGLGLYIDGRITSQIPGRDLVNYIQ